MKKNKYIVNCALLSALAVVLQLLSTLLTNTLQISLTLALIPVAVACVCYGMKCGLIVSAAMGLTLFAECVVGFDRAGGLLFAVNPLLTFVASAGRVVLAAAFVCIIAYETKRFSKTKWRTYLLSAMLPVFNTFIFTVCFITMFNKTLYEWAGGSNVISYIFAALIGVNFLVEVVTCLVICPPIINALGKQKI